MQIKFAFNIFPIKLIEILYLQNSLWFENSDENYGNNIEIKKIFDTYYLWNKFQNE